MAKHWKQLLKQEVITKNSEEEKDTFSFNDILKPNTTSDETSLEDIAASNINLKSLLEEQKELEQNMNALTGKTEEHSNTNKQYDSEIKSIGQKRKEERAREKKQKDLLKKRKNRTKEKNSWLKKEKDVFTIGTRQKIKKEALHPLAKKLKPKVILKNNKQAIATNNEPFEKVKKITQKVSKKNNDVLPILNKVTKSISKFSGELAKIDQKKQQKLARLKNYRRLLKQ